MARRRGRGRFPAGDSSSTEEEEVFFEEEERAEGVELSPSGGDSPSSQACSPDEVSSQRDAEPLPGGDGPDRPAVPEVLEEAERLSAEFRQRVSAEKKVCPRLLKRVHYEILSHPRFPFFSDGYRFAMAFIDLALPINRKWCRLIWNHLYNGTIL